MSAGAVGEVQKYGSSQVAFYRNVMVVGQRRDLHTLQEINGCTAAVQFDSTTVRL